MIVAREHTSGQWEPASIFSRQRAPVSHTIFTGRTCNSGIRHPVRRRGSFGSHDLLFEMDTFKVRKITRVIREQWRDNWFNVFGFNENLLIVKRSCHAWEIVSSISPTDVTTWLCRFLTACKGVGALLLSQANSAAPCLWRSKLSRSLCLQARRRNVLCCWSFAVISNSIDPSCSQAVVCQTLENWMPKLRQRFWILSYKVIASWAAAFDKERVDMRVCLVWSFLTWRSNLWRGLRQLLRPLFSDIWTSGRYWKY